MNAQEKLRSVAHLLELGYEDPLDVAARNAALHRQRDDRFKQAQDLLASGQVNQALELLERLADEWPDWAAPHHCLASVYVGLQRYRLARQHLQWLTYHGCESALLALLQAKVELGERQFDVALDQAQYAKCLDDTLFGSDALMGQVHLRRDDLAAAESAFRRELEKHPNDVTALAGMAALALRRGDHESAIEWALESLEKNMHQPSLHYFLGVALARSDRPAEARAAFETAARLDLQLAAPYRWLAQMASDDQQRVALLAQGRERIRHRRMQRSQ